MTMSTMPSLEALRAIHRHRDEAIVVSTMTGRQEWEGVSKNFSLDFPLKGCMGKASSVALGIALAQPKRKVLVIDGDGSLLMNLGSLVTVANKGPSNYYHFVLEDGAYTTTGGQPIPNVNKISFTGLAMAAGYSNTYEYDNLEEFATSIETIFQRPGPALICLKVRHREVPTSKSRTTQQAIKQLMEILGNP
ncbi:thiamine pyrophosphate-dependent enzyme [Dehalococcoidia bacterium]|nr:thiamine pyrophosphate-dependent enzyme [Dehalococcoidia bacterium]